VHGFNFYDLYVPDLLHEFELGVWKAVYTHLMRILHAYGCDTIQILNERFVIFEFNLFMLSVSLSTDTGRFHHLGQIFVDLLPMPRQ
jgi:purine-cytosine permease-like protein